MVVIREEIKEEINKIKEERKDAKEKFLNGKYLEKERALKGIIKSAYENNVEELDVDRASYALESLKEEARLEIEKLERYKEQDKDDEIRVREGNIEIAAKTKEFDERILELSKNLKFAISAKNKLSEFEIELNGDNVKEQLAIKLSEVEEEKDKYNSFEKESNANIKFLESLSKKIMRRNLNGLDDKELLEDVKNLESGLKTRLDELETLKTMNPSNSDKIDAEIVKIQKEYKKELAGYNRKIKFVKESREALTEKGINLRSLEVKKEDIIKNVVNEYKQEVENSIDSKTTSENTILDYINGNIDLSNNYEEIILAARKAFEEGKLNLKRKDKKKFDKKLREDFSSINELGKETYDNIYSGVISITGEKKTLWKIFKNQKNIDISKFIYSLDISDSRNIQKIFETYSELKKKENLTEKENSEINGIERILPSLRAMNVYSQVEDLLPKSIFRRIKNLFLRKDNRYSFSEVDFYSIIDSSLDSGKFTSFQNELMKSAYNLNDLSNKEIDSLGKSVCIENVR